MAKQVTVNEIENLIKEKLKSSGAELSEDIVSRIKENILQKYNKDKVQNESNDDASGEPVNVDISSEPTEVEQDVPTPGAVQQSVSDNGKEQELSRREEELKRKEDELNRREEELKYKPQLPEPLKEVGKEEFFVFDENQISLGAEALSNTQLYLKNNPEVKSSMIDAWLSKGMTKADLFLVQYKKIGELQFDMADGTTRLDRYTDPSKPSVDVPNAIPVETNVTQSPNMSADGDFLDEIIKEKIEKYISNKFK